MARVPVAPSLLPLIRRRRGRTETETSAGADGLPSVLREEEEGLVAPKPAPDLVRVWCGFGSGWKKKKAGWNRNRHQIWCRFWLRFASEGRRRRPSRTETHTRSGAGLGVGVGCGALEDLLKEGLEGTRTETSPDLVSVRVPLQPS